MTKQHFVIKALGTDGDSSAVSCPPENENALCYLQHSFVFTLVLHVSRSRGVTHTIIDMRFRGYISV